jgi:hypothetical protein
MLTKLIESRQPFRLRWVRDPDPNALVPGNHGSSYNCAGRFPGLSRVHSGSHPFSEMDKELHA